MDLPQSIKNFRQNAPSFTVIPFPDSQPKLLGKKITLWKPAKKPSWLTLQKAGLRCSKRKKSFKTCVQYPNLIEKNFAKAKKEVEAEIIEFFSFLKEVDIPSKMNLLDKFNQKIHSGEIQTIEQMKAFLLKTEELAECIKLHLRKNEYTENFMKEISFDVFEQGFNAKNYSSSNNP